MLFSHLVFGVNSGFSTRMPFLELWLLALKEQAADAWVKPASRETILAWRKYLTHRKEP
jgi:hypothetical protein